MRAYVREYYAFHYVSAQCPAKRPAANGYIKMGIPRAHIVSITLTYKNYEVVGHFQRVLYVHASRYVYSEEIREHEPSVRFAADQLFMRV